MRTSDYMNAYATLDKFNLTDPPSGFYGRPPFQNAKIGPLNASSHGPHATCHMRSCGHTMDGGRTQRKVLSVGERLCVNL